MRKTAARKSGRSNKRKILFIDASRFFFVVAMRLSKPVRALGIVILPIDRCVSDADTPNDDDDDDDENDNVGNRWWVSVRAREKVGPCVLQPYATHNRRTEISSI